jgi:mannitol/fructose-specific phosphotransferase system IIA component (Ntr-type)
MKISDVLERKTVIPNLQSRSKPDVIRELAENLASTYPNINDEKLIEVLMEREKLCSTAVDSGVAIPHAKMSGVSDIIAGFGRSIEGIDYDSLDRLTHLFTPWSRETYSSHQLGEDLKIFKSPEPAQSNESRNPGRDIRFHNHGRCETLKT